jgi:hypothetical protein
MALSVTEGLLLALVVLMGLVMLVPGVARAERPPEQRSEAVAVIEGVVAAIEVISAATHDYDVITVKVVAVIKGTAAKAGAPFKVVGYRLVRQPPPGWVGPSGHEPPPKVGDRIVAYISGRGSHGGFEGVYKDYWDLLPVKP